MFYNPSITYAFGIIMNLNNEVYYGWWLRYLHANGASFFFMCVYLHIYRGIYYGSFAFPRHLLWMIGIIILLLMIITAFLGYILPWGQMSFWGAMVITSLLAAIPSVGADLIFLLWGGYSIHDATLHRFYSLHYTLPFVLLVLSVLHLFFLHEYGSSNPIGLPTMKDSIPFTPYYTIKDTFTIMIIILLLLNIIILVPDLLGHSVNYEQANFLVTPVHIVPEWYLLFFYAILRSVTNKLLGFFFMACSIVILFILPYLIKNFLIRGAFSKPWHSFWFWILVTITFILSWVGGLPVMAPYFLLAQTFTFFYFFIFLFFLPIGAYIDRFVYDCFCYIFFLRETAIILSDTCHYALSVIFSYIEDTIVYTCNGIVLKICQYF
jgi:ubiquinol-cytochrome c reductase cytochrome b/c1 subunit